MKEHVFRKIMALIFATTLLFVRFSVPEFAGAATKFDNSYIITEDKIMEAPSEVLDDPVCIFTGTGNLEGIYVYVEKTSTVNLPMDGEIIRDMLIVNNTDKYIKLETGSEESFSYSGFLSEYVDKDLLIFHPNPFNFYLLPHSSHRAVMTIGFNGYNRLSSDESGEFKYIQRLSVWQPDEEHDTFKPINENIELSMSTKINYYTRDSAPKMIKGTAVVKGSVVDEAGNKPVEYIRVKAENGIVSAVVDIDENGYYTLELYPYYNNYYGTYQPYRIILDLGPNSFNDMKYYYREQIIRPEPGQTITLDLHLKSHTHKPLYEKTGSLELGIQGYWTDWSDDGDTIATVPFHSGIQDKTVLSEDCWLNVYDKTGSYQIKIDMDNETPYVDVSNDGQYIVTQFGDKDNEYTSVKIYKRDGTKVYERNVLPKLGELTGTAYESKEFFSRCSKLSPDNSRLMMSNNNGDIHCIDWKSDKILWSARLGNQIRTIDYSTDGKLIYITCGNGHLYCYDTDGNQRWAAYIGSWGTAIAVGSKYIAVSVKCGTNSLRLIDAKTGKQLWCFDTPSLGYLALSKDESKLYYGNEFTSSFSVASGMVFDTKTGDILFATERGSGNGKFTADGKYLAVRRNNSMNSVIDLFDTTDGSLVWSDSMRDGEVPGSTTTLYISDDGEYIVAGCNTKAGYGTVYFYKRTVAADTNTDINTDTEVDTDTAVKPARGVVSKITDVKGAKVKVTAQKADGAKKYQVKYTVEGDKKVYKASSKSNIIKIKCEKGKKVTVSVRVKNASGWGKWSAKKSFVSDGK